MSTENESERRWYPLNPITGVGVVVVNDGRLLMVRRSREPGRGKWSIPGGKIELGETIFEAGRREVMEECAVEVEIERVLDAVDNIIRDGAGVVYYHFIIIDLLGKYTGGSPGAGSDAAECRWVALGEIEKLDTTPQLPAMLKRRGII